MQEKPMQSPCSRLSLLLSLALIAVAIALNAASLALPRWIAYAVADAGSSGRNSNSDMEFYSRNRGVFLTCVEDAQLQQLLNKSNYRQQVKYNSCFDLDIGQLNPSEVDFIGSSGNGRGLLITLLRRWHLGTQLTAGLLLIIAGVALVIAVSLQRYAGLLVSSSFSCLAAGAQSAALLIFNHSLRLEMMPTAAVQSARLYAGWSETLRIATNMQLSVSFFLACASAGASLLACICCLIFSGQLLTSSSSAANEYGANSNQIMEFDGYSLQKQQPQKSTYPTGNQSHLSDAPSHISSAGRLPRTPAAYPHMY